MPIRIFVGSSVEQLPVARALQAAFQHDRIDVVLWDDEFRAGDLTWERLLEMLDEFDFSVFVFNADDEVKKRNVKSSSMRDNVLLEYGLFAGRLGRERTFFMFDEKARPLLPSDVVGVTPLSYRRLKGQPLSRAIAPVCEELRRTIARLGRRRVARDSGPNGGRLNKSLSGYWVTEEPQVWRHMLKYRERYQFEIIDEHVSGKIVCWDSDWTWKGQSKGRWGKETISKYEVQGSFVDGTIAAQYRSLNGNGVVGAFVFRHVRGELVGGCTYLSTARDKYIDLRSDEYRLVRGATPPTGISRG